MKFERAAGVLLHPTSLISPFGIGDLGEGANDYLRWLAASGAGWWQVLPLQATGAGNSPYATRSSFALNPLLISPQRLVEEGLLAPDELRSAPGENGGRVDYGWAIPFKRSCVERAWERFHAAPPAGLGAAFDEFRHRERVWLDTDSEYAALKEAHGGAAFIDWPEPLAQRDERALAAWRAQHADAVERQVFAQFLVDRQWSAVREAARDLGVKILGDVPMFVAYDSAEVWAERRLFLLDERGRPTVVAGVPPDYFSADGQLWGNPLYDWAAMEREGYAWWVARLQRALELADSVRLDHFRGFAAHWEVPAGEPTAKGGRWVDGPGRALFSAVRAAIGGLPFVAEDLGDITPDVLELRDDLDLPGMAVLQFAFAPSGESTFLPYRHTRHLVVYTGTHDNNTIRGWYEDDATEGERDFVRRYLGRDGREVHWDLIRLALSSVANLVVVPHQDIAGLGTGARMNRPGVDNGNWEFRLAPPMLDGALADRFRSLVEIYGRAPRPPKGDDTPDPAS